MDRPNRTEANQLWGPGTLGAHAGDDPQRFLGAVSPPIFETSLFSFADFDECVAGMTGQSDSYVYTRGRNPTVEIAEAKVAAFEGAEAAKFFASGMGAISAALLSQLRQGSHVVSVRTAYGPTRALLKSWLTRFGVETTFVDGSDVSEIEEAIRETTRVIYLESPSSLLFRLQDLAAVAKLAKERGIVTMIDNSWASPLFQRPLQLGIDVSIHTASKYLGGHSDIVAGVVAGRQEFIDSLLLKEYALLGATLSPFEAWLCLRGMRTLGVRMQRHHESALSIARTLEQHPKVRRVIHPGLESHPQHELAKRQMSGYGGLFAIELDAPTDGIRRFVNALRLFRIGVSWGGYESLVFPAGAIQAAQGGSAKRSQVPPGLLRLYIGLEEADDLLRDLEQALERV